MSATIAINPLITRMPLSGEPRPDAKSFWIGLELHFPFPDLPPHPWTGCTGAKRAKTTGVLLSSRDVRQTKTIPH